MSLFENATRKKYRYFIDNKIDNKNKPGYFTGYVTTEDLWDFSLEELDKTAVALNRKIKETQEESFLAKSKTDDGLLEQLEVLKRVIAYKQEQEEAKARELERKAKEKTLLELLDKKQQKKLDSLSEEELLEQLREVQAR